MEGAVGEDAGVRKGREKRDEGRGREKWEVEEGRGKWEEGRGKLAGFLFCSAIHVLYFLGDTLI